MINWMLYETSFVHSMCPHSGFGKLPLTEVRGVSRTAA